MLWKVMKLGAITATGGAILGGLVFGSDLASYLRSSRNSVALVVRDNIPIDFQIRRARDLLAATEPEMRRNVRLMAEEEVDIALLNADIVRSTDSLQNEKARLQKLRRDLAGAQTSFTVGQFTYTRDQVVQELTRRFHFYEEAEAALAQKRQLLVNRQKALAAAGEAIEGARAKRVMLAGQVEALEGRQRLLRATSSGADVRFDDSKLAQAQQVVSQLDRQLDIAEHTLAREAKFAEPMALADAVDEKELLNKVDAHLSGKTSAAAAPAPAAAAPPSAPATGGLSDATGVEE